MTVVINAPDDIPEGHRLIYLAGAIDMGEAENWQKKVISILSKRDDLTLLNPRRSNFEPQMEEEQIKWELRALEKADVILMWFPRESNAPISLLEFGLYLKSGKLLVGVENGFYRQRNIELTAQYHGVSVFHSLAELVQRI